MLTLGDVLRVVTKDRHGRQTPRDGIVLSRNTIIYNTALDKVRGREILINGPTWGYCAWRYTQGNDKGQAGATDITSWACHKLHYGHSIRDSIRS